jgi:8-oxo-dGTP diphosphatase
MSLEGRKPVEVAVGVLIRPDGSFLLGSRPQGKPYEGYWEFPGGKVEPGESLVEALTRELDEEIGVHIATATPWITIEHRYTHAHVRLHFMRVFEWRGEPHGRETQSLAWCRLNNDTPVTPLPSPLLPATLPCLRWLGLPRVMGISQATELGTDAFLAKLAIALERGLQLVQIREPDLDADRVEHLVTETVARAREHGARVLVNSCHRQALWELAQGVHFRSVDLAALTERPALAHVGASVHSRAELLRCGYLALDHAVLGPVTSTLTHPGQAPLGWNAFGEIALDSPVPVFAVGGMRRADVDAGATHGAHGIAAIRSVWADPD